MKLTTRNIAIAAIIGAVYASLTMFLAPISYGPVQLRLSEILCIVPFFIPSTAWGLFIGCVCANLISSAGILDIIFGSLATLLAALCTARLGKYPREHGVAPSMKRSILACAMPVLFNAPIIGAVLAITSYGVFWEMFSIISIEIAISEAIVMFGAALPLMRAIPHMRLFQKFYMSR